MLSRRPRPSAAARTAIGAPNDNQRPPTAPFIGIERGPSRPTALTPCSNPKAAPRRWIRDKVNADMVSFVQSRSPRGEATLDMDATLVETHKQQALYSYRKYRAYQPLTVYWAEAEVIVHSEFRDGNVPAGYQQLRVFTEALEYLSCGVDRVRLRSDAAGYEHELLRYCAEGRDERFGVIEFAVGVDVTPEFRRVVCGVAEQDWRPLFRRLGSTWVETGQQWAEVNFVPNWIGHSKKSPEYRFIAIREPLREQPLPGLQAQLELLPFPAMRMAGGAWHKVSGVVTNRELAGDEVVRWYRQRCGKGKQVHSVLKSDLAARRLPSGLFGANAAWWAIAVLAFNLSSAMKRLVLGGQWVSKRLKAVRFALIALPGRVMRRARRLIIRLARGHPSYELLIRARQRILALSAEPVPSISGPVCASVEGDSARSPRLGHALFGLRTAIYGVGPLPILAKTPAKALPTPESTPEHGRKHTNAAPTMLDGEFGSSSRKTTSGCLRVVPCTLCPATARHHRLAADLMSARPVNSPPLKNRSRT